MKRMGLFISTLLLVLFLTACQNEENDNIEVFFLLSEGTLSTNAVTINLNIIDTDVEITGNIVVTLTNASNVRVGNETRFQTIAEAKVLTYSNLLPDNTYKVNVTATTGRTSRTIGTYTFKTLSLQSLNIETVEDFLAMGVNRSGDFILKNDLDFTDVEFITPFTSAFTGSFDGQGFMISNVLITNTRLYNGVFGFVSSGNIKNVHLNNISIGTEAEPIKTSSTTRIGILAGYQSSSLSVFEDITITNSSIYLETSTSLTSVVGGVVGEVRGTVSNVVVTQTRINMLSTSNGTVRLGGAYGLMFESSRVFEHDVDVEIAFALEAVTSTRANRTYNISIGGFAAEVDPASVNNAFIHSIRHEAKIVVSKLNFNPLANDTGTYTVLVGGLFGNLNRGLYDIYTKNSIEVLYALDAVVTQVSKTLRVNGISPVYNTFDAPRRIVLEGLTMIVTHPDDVRVQINQGLVLHSTDAIKVYDQTVNEIVINENNLTVIPNVIAYFESEYLNELLAD